MNFKKKVLQAVLAMQAGLLGWVLVRTFFAWSDLMNVVHLDGFPYQGGPDKVTPSAFFIAALIFSIDVTRRSITSGQQSV